MPTFHHGKSTAFTMDDAGGTVRNIANALDNVDFPQSVETGETTAFGASSKSYIVGLTDATLSISGRWDATVDGYLTGTEPAYSGECIKTGYSTANPVADVVTFSADFQVTGNVTRTT